jgi:hypothetical protein
MKDCLAERPHRKKPENRINVPWYKQTDDYSCGVVAGWIAIKALYPSRRNKHVFRKDCNPSKEYGTSTAKLACALRKHGVRVSVRKELSFKDIKACVDYGLPIVACIKVDDSLYHWVTIYGYACKKKKMVYLCNNGWSDANGEMSYREFKKLDGAEYLICSIRCPDHK